MKVLAVETSGHTGSVAVATDQNTVFQRPLSTSGRRHARTLVAEAGALLREHRLAPTDIDLVAVSIGPGSFTGLRVGVVFAKTFAWANQAQLVAVDTLQAVAQKIPHRPDTVTVVSDAQRGEVFVNTYRWDTVSELRLPISQTSIQPVEVVAADQLQLVTGPGLKKFASSFQSDHVADSALWFPDAAEVIRLGQHELAAGRVCDLHSLEPVYLRRSYAEEKRDAR